jgi:hypothetical protein
MRRFRFSIASLLGVVLFAALALAALRAATDAWDSGVFTTTVLIFLVALLLTVHGTERRRAYWLGFALFGWAYLAASLIPSIEARLPSTWGFARVQAVVAADYDNDGSVDLFIANQWSQGVFLNNGNGTFRIATSNPAANMVTQAIDSAPPGRWFATWQRVVGSSGTPENRLRIMHSLLALVIAVAGGRLSGSLYAASRRRRDEMTVP